ncbi:hypothetical protein CEE36_08375 [candidate division TA06 bacterium B3_TA06]|uniref:Uncharacterized protein n=1 Tax=candidate division TA06 bacterium B3_TA06 TaxID=2012487 RepID=A0A532V287_UNCT6|nr:MAG: hypothetical protein CEE36_08375 [candidate division TA06 bacterium B3_TA06]
MRGLAVSWCYDRVEEGLTALQNPYQAMVFAQGSRVVGRERLDPRVATLSQGPTAVLHVGQVALYNAQGYGGPEVIYRNGADGIVHTGTGMGKDKVSIDGNHSGNNSYVIEITESGEVGSGGKYELSKTPWTGSEWGEEEVVSSGSIPSDGKIEVGNDSTFVFQLNENVVQGDTYSWETEAYRVTNQQIRNATVPITAEIETVNEEEIIGSGGYLDQLMLMFARKKLAAELYDGHYEEVTEEMNGMSVTSYIENEQTLYRIDLVVHYSGKVFMAEVSPLITRMEYDEPDIP